MRIGIAGAGLLGRLFAHQLTHREVAFDLWDNGEGSAAAVAAGMLSPYCELECRDEFICRLGEASLPLWREWFGKSLPLLEGGTLCIASPEHRQELDRFESLISYYRPFITDRMPTRELEPEIAETFPEALWVRNEAAIDTQQFIEETNHFLCKSSQPSNDFDWILDCRGIGAKSSLPKLRGVRGELLLIENKEIHFRHPIRLLDAKFPLYVVPRSQSRFVIGATQIESEDTGPMTARSAVELLNAAYSIDPRFAESRILEMRMGLRPALPHHRPQIFVEEKMLRINGLYRHGYLVAPKVVEIALDFILHHKTDSLWKELVHGNPN